MYVLINHMLVITFTILIFMLTFEIVKSKMLRVSHLMKQTDLHMLLHRNL